MAGFHIEHFGCRAARADGEAMAGNLRAMSELEPFAADVVIVNTCSVTAEADRAARAFIRRAHRKNPAAKIVVTGCYAQRAPEELAAMAGVAAVVGNSHKALAPEIILNLIREWEWTRGAGRMTSAASPVPKCEGPGAPAVVPVASLLAASASKFSVGAAQVPASTPIWAPIWADDRFAHSFIEDVQWGDAQLALGTQTRPNLKIQEGCGNRCAFCVIPFTRGPSQSLPYAVVMRRVESFVAAGGKELVLSGINLGRWGRDVAGPEFAEERNWSPILANSQRTRIAEGGAPADRSPTLGAPAVSLAGLVRAILEKTGLQRLRLSSIEPMDWDDALIALMGEFGGRRLARHAHLPVQSGSDAVLRRMHRRYRPWHYAEKVAALVGAAGPDLTLGADVMVGFPGETDGEFEETLAFIRALPFGYLHLFPFSARPGTRGWALHETSPVPQAATEERMAALRALAAEKSGTHRRRFVGREIEAITLHTPAALARRGSTTALTENFLPVELEGSFAANQLLRMRVTGINTQSELTASTSA
jgi:threonylcarbamoyladenosine tRNA methylthiotransferase MtaB